MPPRVQLERRQDLLGDIARRAVQGACGVLMGAHHRAVDGHRPVRTLSDIGVAAQLVEHTFPGAIS